MCPSVLLLTARHLFPMCGFASAARLLVIIILLTEARKASSGPYGDLGSLAVKRLLDLGGGGGGEETAVAALEERRGLQPLAMPELAVALRRVCVVCDAGDCHWSWRCRSCGCGDYSWAGVMMPAALAVVAGEERGEVGHGFNSGGRRADRRNQTEGAPSCAVTRRHVLLGYLLAERRSTIPA